MKAVLKDCCMDDGGMNSLKRLCSENTVVMSREGTVAVGCVRSLNKFKLDKDDVMSTFSKVAVLADEGVEGCCVDD